LNVKAAFYRKFKYRIYGDLDAALEGEGKVGGVCTDEEEDTKLGSKVDWSAFRMQED
jgi:hypothetical protein